MMMAVSFFTSVSLFVQSLLLLAFIWVDFSCSFLDMNLPVFSLWYVKIGKQNLLTFSLCQLGLVEGIIVFSHLGFVTSINNIPCLYSKPKNLLTSPSRRQ
ncbi:hypothetical protein ACH5RR_011405 [Cinchona calisaya]|uniref:Uncharacterized protein n=1 Tax=Cinchona calisaya TaxID=153742 RepID=A0ABD3A4W6_9GENT